MANTIRSIAAGICTGSLILAGIERLSANLIVAGIAAGIAYIAHLKHEITTK